MLINNRVVACAVKTDAVCRGAFAYVEAAFKETLRLYPTAPILMRQLEADTQLGRFALRKGEVVAVAVYGMHRNPAYWKASTCLNDAQGTLTAASAFLLKPGILRRGARGW